MNESNILVFISDIINELNRSMKKKVIAFGKRDKPSYGLFKRISFKSVVDYITTCINDKRILLKDNINIYTSYNNHLIVSKFNKLDNIYIISEKDNIKVNNLVELSKLSNDYVSAYIPHIVIAIQRNSDITVSIYVYFIHKKKNIY